MKKINLKGISEILNEKEMKNVRGGVLYFKLSTDGPAVGSDCVLRCGNNGPDFGKLAGSLSGPCPGGGDIAFVSC